MKNNKGITLIALSVMIIVLIIIASVDRNRATNCPTCSFRKL